MTTIPSPRWDPYFFRGDPHFFSFWQDHLTARERKLLFVLGLGFDPRMNKALDTVLSIAPQIHCDCLTIDFDEGPGSPSTDHRDLVETNRKQVGTLVASHGILRNHTIQMWDSSGPIRRRIGPRNAARVFTNFADFYPYTDIIIDISALPRSLYFPLIGSTLNFLDGMASSSRAPNLHVVVCENHALDAKIVDVGVDDDASYIPGFAADLEAESFRDVPTIWFPVLGEAQRLQLQRLYELVDPDEVVLVLPWPSVNPRRADSLVGEYHDLLFDQWRIEPANVLYAPEQNPFEAYRQIRQAALRYDKALKPLGGCKTAISAISSKLLSLGALLAVYELRKLQLPVGLAHVEAKGYMIQDNVNLVNLEQQNKLFTLWVSGECYDL